MRASILAAFVVTSFGLAACGGSQKEAEEPSSETAAEESTPKHKTELASSSAEEKDEADGKKDDDGEKSDKKDKKADKEEEEKPSHTAKDVIAKPDSLWVYSYADSEPHQNAEKKCKEKSKDDPKKTADCMAKTSKNTERDALAFQMKGDKLYFLTVDRKGGTLNITHKIPCDISDESETKITLKPNGKDEGSRPGGGFGTLVIELDGESAFSMNDAKLGKLVYQAKLGLMGKQDR
ncbi:MAG TPA: hypothetical protein VHE30_00555 [Polyangiaceae bacterium]|nr:hypothetical protein [Polyangiaceae bacterium]